MLVAGTPQLGKAIPALQPCCNPPSCTCNYPNPPASEGDDVNGIVFRPVLIAAPGLGAAVIVDGAAAIGDGAAAIGDGGAAERQ